MESRMRFDVITCHTPTDLGTFTCLGTTKNVLAKQRFLKVLGHPRLRKPFALLPYPFEPHVRTHVLLENLRMQPVVNIHRRAKLTSS